MLLSIGRFFLTVIYGLIGLKLGLPLSYFFQDSIYNEMRFIDYVSGGFSSITIGASFGAYDVYRACTIGSIIVAVIMGKWLEHRIIKKRQINSNK